ncbi:bestrophin family ion channel [Dokdonella sp.]|uniref:bestrophin family protein n=1 Tax=Dokdonella sp. TaxID=2291710 RepID=UPI001B14F1B6|nr:bestrophin family ion channel [Dokdonella sp.]MBO9661672.1 multidrug transporter [Dokdonella sp.]
MRIGKPYTVWEFVVWTRRASYVLIALAVVPALLRQWAGWTWLTIPLGVVVLLGTTVALSAGFKMQQTYGRMLEAQQIWSSIASASRAWGFLCRDSVADPARARELVQRHFAWLAALRHQLRRTMPWETTDKAYNVEYRRLYRIHEREESLEAELARYVGPDDAARMLASRSQALQALDLQRAQTRRLLDEGGLGPAAFAELQKAIRDFQEQQGRAERIKNYPYPRQHAFINSLFVRILCVLLPLGVMGEFARLDGLVDGWAKGHMVWFGVPLGILISWMYASLDRVGESTENPFEGGANDVPITRICREIEDDLREMLGEAVDRPAYGLDEDIAL